MGVVLAILKWLGIGLGVLIVGIFLFALFRFGPAAMTLAWAQDLPNGPSANPPLALPFDADAARAALKREVYGSWPGEGEVRVLDVRRDNLASGERVHIDLAAEANGVELRYGVSLVRRRPADPLIVWSSFSPRGAAIEGAPGGRMDGFGASVVEFVFGRYIQSPPIDDILDRGYGFAVLHPPEALPDSRAAIDRVRSMGADTGAIIGWAWMAARALDALEAEGEARGPVIAGGHSRYGKSALVWAAWDERVDGVIAHQSGTGGASLSKDKRGETVAQMVESYPHWFAPGYAEDSLTIDQHHLLALVAPRPVLLGGAVRDVWSDPNGALRAAMGAAPVYREMTGRAPLAAERLDVWEPSADIAIWQRAGTHGIVEEDWPAFLAFLDAHFPDDRERSDDEPLRTAGERVEGPAGREDERPLGD